MTPDVILTRFLPALLFEGSLKFEVRHRTTHIVPLLLLATLGGLIATIVTGFVIYYVVGCRTIGMSHNLTHETASGSIAGLMKHLSHLLAFP